MMKPYLVNSINNLGVVLKTFEPKVLVEKICSDETLGKLKACLLDVVESEHGTGHALKSSLYMFAGKTGTAVSALDNRGYNKGNKIYQSAFIGFFPFDKPEYTIAVVIQNSNESKLAYGGVVSGPVFREVADKIYAASLNSQPEYKPAIINDSINYQYFGLKTDINKILNVFKLSFIDSAITGSWRSISMYNNQALLRSAAIPSQSGNITPDVRGLGLKDAVYLLENFGLRVSAGGKGKVIYQSITAGSNFNKGQKIDIQLN
jgi:cell division protein FtsI (penicillin-binding protein 3)